MECGRCGFAVADPSASVCDVCGQSLHAERNYSSAVPDALVSLAHDEQVAEISSDRAVVSSDADLAIQPPDTATAQSGQDLTATKVRVVCPECGKSHRISASKIGRRVACRKCPAKFTAVEEPKRQDSAGAEDVFKFNCPRCDKRYKLPRAKVGHRKFKCRRCSHRFAPADVAPAEVQPILLGEEVVSQDADGTDFPDIDGFLPDLSVDVPVADAPLAVDAFSDGQLAPLVNELDPLVNAPPPDAAPQGFLDDLSEIDLSDSATPPEATAAPAGVGAWSPAPTVTASTGRQPAGDESLESQRKRDRAAELIAKADSDVTRDGRYLVLTGEAYLPNACVKSNERGHYRCSAVLIYEPMYVKLIRSFLVGVASALFGAVGGGAVGSMLSGGGSMGTVHYSLSRKEYWKLAGLKAAGFLLMIVAIAMVVIAVISIQHHAENTNPLERQLRERAGLAAKADPQFRTNMIRLGTALSALVLGLLVINSGQAIDVRKIDEAQQRIWVAGASEEYMSRFASLPHGESLRAKEARALVILGYVSLAAILLIGTSLSFVDFSGFQSADRVPNPLALFSVHDVPLPDLNVAPEFDESDGVYVADVDLGVAPGVAGHNDRLRIYLPEREPQVPLPCIFMAPAGTPVFAGIKISAADNAAFLPYAQAGFAVVAYEVDGELPGNDPEQWSFAQLKSAYNNHLKSSAGLANARNAIEYALKQLPVDSDRLYTIGHSSAGKQALLLASHDTRIDACVAFAAPTDLLSGLDSELKAIAAHMPRDFVKFIRRASPSTHASNIECPVLMFHSSNDQIVSSSHSTDFADRLKELGKSGEARLVDGIDHYSIADATRRDAIEWLKSNPKYGAPEGDSLTAAAPSLVEVDESFKAIRRAASQGFVETYRLPNTTFCSAFDTHSGHLAIGHDTYGFLVFDVNQRSDSIEPLAELAVDGLPANACFKTFGREKWLCCSGLQSQTVTVFSGVDYGQRTEIPPPADLAPGVSVAYLAVSESSDDPHLYVSWRSNHGSAKELPTLVSRINLSLLTQSQTQAVDLDLSRVPLPTYRKQFGWLPKQMPPATDESESTNITKNERQLREHVDYLQILLSLRGDLSRAPLLRSIGTSTALDPTELVNLQQPNSDNFDRCLLRDQNLTLRLLHDSLRVVSPENQAVVAEAKTPEWERTAPTQDDARIRVLFRERRPASHTRFFNAHVDSERQQALVVTDRTLRVLHLEEFSPSSLYPEVGWDIPLFVDADEPLKFQIGSQVTAATLRTANRRSRQVQGSLREGIAQFRMDEAAPGACTFEFQLAGGKRLRWAAEIEFRNQEIAQLPFHATGMVADSATGRALVWGKVAESPDSGLAWIDLAKREVIAHKVFTLESVLCAALNEDSAFVVHGAEGAGPTLSRVTLPDFIRLENCSLQIAPKSIEILRNKFLVAKCDTPYFASQRYGLPDLKPLIPEVLTYHRAPADGAHPDGLVWQGMLWGGEPVTRRMLVDFPSLLSPAGPQPAVRRSARSQASRRAEFRGTAYELRFDRDYLFRLYAQRASMRCDQPLDESRAPSLIAWPPADSVASPVLASGEDARLSRNQVHPLKIVVLGQEPHLLCGLGTQLHMHPVAALFKSETPSSSLAIESIQPAFFLSPRKSSVNYQIHGAQQSLLRVTFGSTLLAADTSDDGQFQIDLSDGLDGVLKNVMREVRQEAGTDASLGDLRRWLNSKIEE